MHFLYLTSFDTAHGKAHLPDGSVATEAFEDSRGCLAPPVCCLEEGLVDEEKRQSTI